MVGVKSIVTIVALFAIVTVLGIVAVDDGGITGATLTNVACFHDKDCNDGINATQDLCRNPGTEYSLCVNKPVEKSLDEE